MIMFVHQIIFVYVWNLLKTCTVHYCITFVEKIQKDEQTHIFLVLNSVKFNPRVWKSDLSFKTRNFLHYQSCTVLLLKQKHSVKLQCLKLFFDFLVSYDLIHFYHAKGFTFSVQLLYLDFQSTWGYSCPCHPVCSFSWWNLHLEVRANLLRKPFFLTTGKLFSTGVIIISQLGWLLLEIRCADIWNEKETAATVFSEYMLKCGFTLLKWKCNRYIFSSFIGIPRPSYVWDKVRPFL